MFVTFTVDSKKLGSGDKNYTTCLTENNVSDDDIFTLQDIIHDRHKSEDQNKIKMNGCVAQCLFQKAGIMQDAEYHPDFEKTEKTNAQPEDKLFEALDNCINETKNLTKKCEKAFALTECFLKAQDKIFPTSENHEECEHEHEHQNESEK